MTRDYSLKGRPCVVEYFDSMTMRNQRSDGAVKSTRFDASGEQLVEVELASRKIVTVPSEYVAYLEEVGHE